MKPISQSPILRAVGRVLTRSGIIAAQDPEAVRETMRLRKVVEELEAAIESVQPSQIIMPNVISRDMNTMFLKRMRDEAFKAYNQNPIAKRALKLRRALVAQQGFMIESDCGNDIVQEFLDEHWEINWARHQQERIDALSTFGEWSYLIPESNAVNGHFEMGLIDPDLVDKITPAKLNAERRGTLHLTEPLKLHRASGEVERIKELNVVYFDWLTKKYRGDVLYLGVNTITSMMRGVSDLLPVLDWLEGFDQITWVELERLRNMRSFLWHRVIHGAEKEAIDAARRQWQKNPPKPGTCWVSNESEELKALSPSLNTAESKTYLDFLFGIIWGGLELPQHYFYTAGSVNRASAEEMSDPVYAGIRDRKHEISEFMCAGAQIAVDRAAKTPGTRISTVPKDELGIQVACRDPERSAYDVIGTQLQAFAQAVVIGEQSEYISDVQAGKMYRAAAAAMGLGDIPSPEEESDNLACAQQYVDNALGDKRDELSKILPLSLNGESRWALKPGGKVA